MYHLPLLSWLIFFAACTTTVIAQSEDCDQSQYLFPIGELTNNNAIDRYFSLSTTSPVTNLIRSDPALTKALDPVYDLFDTFTAIIEKRRRDNDFLACNVPISFRYIRASRKSVERRQFGAFLKVPKCVSRIDLDIAVQREEVSKEEREQAFDTLRTGLEALFQAASHVDVIPSTNWTRGTFRTFGFKRFQTEQECTIDSLFAYRRNGAYYLRASATNWPSDLFIEDFNRQQINEYVPREGTTALRGPHIKFGTDCVFENSSTQLTRWGGLIPLAHGGNAELDNRFGVFHLASRANSVAVDIAEDSLTGSNVAILALPMVMNFVPVAFIADLNTFAMLCYVIFTDVFSSLPFLIKGVELFRTGNGMRRAMGAYQLGNSTLGQMEIFTTDCRGKESYRVIGIVFISVAIVLMIFGVWLEVFARSVMKRRRRMGKEGGPFGEMMESVGYGPMGGHTEDEKTKRLTCQLMMEEGIGARDRSSGDGESERNSYENSVPSFPTEVSNALTSLKRDEGSNSGNEGRRRNSGNSSDGRKKGAKNE